MSSTVTMVTMRLPRGVNSALPVAKSESIKRCASKLEDGILAEVAPIAANFSAIEDCIVAARLCLPSSSMKMISATIFCTLPLSQEKPSGTAFTTMVSLPSGAISKPRPARVSACSSSRSLFSTPT